MKPEYRSLDPVGRSAADAETIASLITRPATIVDRTWSIGELARECDVTQRALRFYEGKGLLTPVREGSARLYGGEDVRRLKLILRLKGIGFSLVEVRDLLARFGAVGTDSGRLAALMKRIETQVAALEAQRREVEASLTAVAREIDGLKRIIGA